MLSRGQIGNSSIREDRHLYLVGTVNTRDGLKQKRCTTSAESEKATVVQLTNALMNRLGIPHSTTIVGLLHVGLSRTNYDELSKWIAFQATTLPSGCIADNLTELERRFCRAVDHFSNCSFE